MAHKGLQVAVLSLVCLIAVVTSDNEPQVPPESTDAEICKTNFNVDSKMTSGAAFNMVFNNFKEYFKPGLGNEEIHVLVRSTDQDGDMYLDLSECEQFIKRIKLRIPGQK